jgi:phosphate transport system substrate-binding protein
VNRLFLGFGVVVAIGCSLWGCRRFGSSTEEDSGTSTVGDEARLLDTAGGTTIHGAGATFPFPVYAKWAYVYHKTSGTRLNYQAIGSGAGISQTRARTVDFGATDAPLTSEELNDSGLIQFPMVIGGVVPVVHLEGISSGALKLSREVLSQIFLGKIRSWNDRQLVDLNPDIVLPELSISVVYRSDSSGTTWVFTRYLDRVSEEWREKVGYDKSVNWPTGIGGKGNEGVVELIQQMAGAIGYVQYAHVRHHGLTSVQLENREGHYVEPSLDTFRSAAGRADWENAAGLSPDLTDPLGIHSWPVIGASFILLHREQRRARTALEVMKFFSWCYEHGGGDAENLHFVPIPATVIHKVKEMWSSEIRSDGHPIWK